MNVSMFSKVIYKGNINIDFYLFCLKRDFKLIRFLFVNIWYYILSFLFNKKRNIYEIRKFRYLKYVDDLDNVIDDFYKKNKIYNIFKIDYNFVIDKVPKILVRGLNNTKSILYELDDNYDVCLERFDKELLKFKKIDNMYLSGRYKFLNIYSNNNYVVNSSYIKYIGKRREFNKNFCSWFLLVLCSLIITCFSFLFTNSYLNLEMFYSYFEFKLFMLNFVPILVIMILLYLVSKRVHISWLITSFCVFGLGVANQTKVFYRDDVVKFEDIALIKEALIMSNNVGVVIKSYTVIFLLLIIFMFFVIKKHLNKNNYSRIKNCILIVGVIVLMFFGYRGIYKNNNIYDSVGDESLINRWIFTRQSQIRGLIYPFICSIDDGIIVEPDDYDEDKVVEILSEYKYQNIPKDKKVNVIAIMLEAYNDFSKFDEIEFKEDIYKEFHKIQKDSISGNLVTSIFGGGTITTERNFLTGYYELSSFRKKTNSYVWYFKEQGYRTEAMHPIYGAFYNRASVNPNLGFDIYYNYENMFSNIECDTEFVSDDLFFDAIIEGYENSKKDGVPYFNFSVTYQNHVPYNSSYYEGKEYYFDNVGLDDVSYNLINEYFSWIKKTNDALKYLINYFDNEDEPVVVVLFGDHNPALGDNASVYHELGINIDVSNLDGFLNYYETPYVIHANESARKMFDNDFVGNGDDISPIFLMNELFNNMGIKGNNYMQYMNDFKNNIDVISSIYYKEDGEFVNAIDSKYLKLIKEYNSINYYQITKKYKDLIK